jgi:hypothetical protein
LGLSVSARDVTRDLPHWLAALPPGAHAGARPRPAVHGRPPRALYAYGRDTPPTPRCVYWFLRLVLDQSMCRRKFGSSAVIFIFFICFNPFIAS